MPRNLGPVLREEVVDPSVTSLDEVRHRKQVEALTRAHGEYLRGLARRLCRSQLDPDDLVQDVLEKAIRNPIPDAVNERAWLSRVMQNQFIDMLRRASTRREDVLDDEAAAAPVEHEVWWLALTADDIRAQVAKLPDEQRATFELFAFEQRSYDEIAAELKIAKATVGTRILRARQKIRELLSKERSDA
jgi:RNA polymerase sigma-70 factor (ECF subfamily)